MPSPAARPPRGKGGKEGPVTAPFTIVVDMDEKKPYRFEGMRTNKDAGHRPIVVPLEFKKRKLPVGDYTIVGMENRIIIERKSKSDLYGSIGRRKNFIGRLEEMEAIARHPLGGYAAVMVEASDPDLLVAPPFAKIAPLNISRTIISWRLTYGVDWWFMASRERAEATTFRILERFYRGQKRHAIQP